MPLRIEVGPRDIEKDALLVGFSVATSRRRTNISVPEANSSRPSAQHLQTMHDALFPGALPSSATRTPVEIDTKEEFYTYFTAAEVDENAADTDTTAASPWPTSTATRTRSQDQETTSR